MVSQWIFSIGTYSSLLYFTGLGSHLPYTPRCLIVKTESYTREQVAKVVELRATVEGLSLGDGVLDRLSAEGARRSLR